MYNVHRNIDRRTDCHGGASGGPCRRARLQDTRSQEEKLAYWYAVAQQEVAQFESSLAGVA